MGAIWMCLVERLGARLMRISERLAPDFVVGDPSAPYLRRWYLTPWRRWLSYHDRAVGWRRWLSWPARLLPQVYLHQFLRSDDDRALHDHPWPWMSLILDGAYWEVRPHRTGLCHSPGVLAYEILLREAGSVAVRGPWALHRVELRTIADYVASQPDNDKPVPCWTLFVTGPRVRNWGFLCPERGWVPWQEFTAAKSGKPGEIGPGCDA